MDAYERFAYPGYAYAATHPARLEVVGRLFGLHPGRADEARVLELGCGDGGNVLSLAQALPGARFVGLDAAAGGIERGAKLARSAGIENAQLLCLDLEDLPADLGEFDYILAHGVYSWIPPRVRAALLTALRRHLAPQGIAYVSYNAYPGSYLRDMARDILAYHVRDIADPHERLAAAQELMRTIVAIEEPSPYARLLREHMERMLRYSDALLLHDDLAEIATPFYLHEFVEQAERHGLAFLAEAELSESQMRGVPESAAQLMQGLPDDMVVREQYLDFFKNRMFRQTLLCHGEAEVSRELDETQIEGFFVAAQLEAADEGREGDADGGEDEGGNGERGENEGSTEAPDEETFVTPEGFTVTTSEPLVRAALHALAEAWPASLPFSELIPVAAAAAGSQCSEELVAARLRTVLLQAYLGRIVQLESCAPDLSVAPGERPVVSTLARVQCAAGLPALSSLLHANVRLDEESEARLLALLDGTRSRDGLARELGVPVEEVDASLLRFASLGLLAA
ncbi:MAG: methyltransferase regulatory domain-containing protein [Solirubrobacteraceae bacterium]